MATAVPRRPRPHSPVAGPSAKIQSLKEQLIQRIVRGDQEGAESMRRQLRIESLKQQADQEAANAAPETGASIAVWLGADGERESVEMTATPEAQAYFDQLSSKLPD
jgi:hypothetical protein